MNVPLPLSLHRKATPQKPAPSVFDPRFIPDIFEGCDHWCERCAQTRRCHHYAMKEAGHAVLRDLNAHAGWSRTGRDQHRALRDHLREDENWTEAERAAAVATWRQKDLAREAKAQPLLTAAVDYYTAVRRWMEDATPLLEAKAQAGMPSAPPEAGGTQASGESLSDCIEVVDRYADVTWTALHRALVSWVDAFMIPDGEGEVEVFPEFCNGRVKAALMGMDRSIGAWTVLGRLLEEKAAGISSLLGQLTELRKATERFFPNARNFVRPGLDEPFRG